MSKALKTVCDSPTCGCTCPGVIVLKLHGKTYHYCNIDCLVNGVLQIRKDTAPYGDD